MLFFLKKCENLEHLNYFKIGTNHDPSKPYKPVKEWVIKKKSTGNIPIVFAPTWICEVTAKLVI